MSVPFFTERTLVPQSSAGMGFDSKLTGGRSFLEWHCWPARSGRRWSTSRRSYRRARLAPAKPRQYSVRSSSSPSCCSSSCYRLRSSVSRFKMPANTRDSARCLHSAPLAPACHDPRQLHHACRWRETLRKNWHCNKKCRRPDRACYLTRMNRR